MDNYCYYSQFMAAVSWLKPVETDGKIPLYNLAGIGYIQCISSLMHQITTL